MAISRSSPVNSQRWRLVRDFSARNTGPNIDRFTIKAHSIEQLNRHKVLTDLKHAI